MIVPARTTALGVFAKAPERGLVKTRLAAAIGADDALRVYRGLLRATAAVVAAWPGPTALLAAGDARLLARCFDGVPAAPQRGGTLGARLRHGLGPLLRAHGRAIAIGTDCPGCSVERLAALDDLLADHEVAFGPSTDGGYWALGLASRRALEVCCADRLPWSRATLLRASLRACREADIPAALGEPLADVDTVDDLRLAEADGFRW